MGQQLPVGAVIGTVHVDVVGTTVPHVSGVELEVVDEDRALVVVGPSNPDVI